MLTYYDLSVPFKCLIQMLLFVEICFGAFILWSMANRKKPYSKLTVSCCILLSTALLIVYTAEARANLRDLEVVQVSDWLCSKPLLIPIIILAVVAGLLFYFFLQDVHFRRNIITRSSIREGMNKISSGLCFYTNSGRIILSNQRMSDLCFAIIGRDLQNGELFWNVLRDGEVLSDVHRLSFGDHPGFRLSDGKVWTFACENIDGIYQLTAADTTGIQAVTDELKVKNSELAALNLRLRKHGENVDEFARSKERLETKARIHRELGQALLSTRRFLMDNEGEHTPPLQLWQQNVAMLRKEAEGKEEEQPLEMLTRIAASTGISVDLTGEIPKDIQVQKLIVQAAAEALTNAISHAQAETLFIKLSENEHTYRVYLKNDGIQPTEEVTEGGGLTSLRQKIEGEAGSMQIISMPEFTIVIILPKERGRNYD